MAPRPMLEMWGNDYANGRRQLLRLMIHRGPRPGFKPPSSSPSFSSSFARRTHAPSSRLAGMRDQFGVDDPRPRLP